MCTRDAKDHDRHKVDDDHDRDHHKVDDDRVRLINVAIKLFRHPTNIANPIATGWVKREHFVVTIKESITVSAEIAETVSDIKKERVKGNELIPSDATIRSAIKLIGVIIISGNVTIQRETVTTKADVGFKTIGVVNNDTILTAVMMT